MSFLACDTILNSVLRIVIGPQAQYPKDYPQRCSDPERAASLRRFYQKKQNRCYEKKIRYDVRREVAVRFVYL